MPVPDPQFAVLATQRVAPPPPTKIWHASEPPFQGYTPPDISAFRQTDGDTTIVIDSG